MWAVVVAVAEAVPVCFPWAGLPGAVVAAVVVKLLAPTAEMRKLSLSFAAVVG